MCGIAGILKLWPAEEQPLALRTPPGEAIAERWLDTLDDAIKHRGPDGQGRFRDRATRADGRVVDVALVHRRLSIIDPAGGAQPMISSSPDADELVCVVFNGCIYNHRALRAELEAAGRRFSSNHADTEVLVQGWRQWGEDLLPRLDGMFAFALWDRAAARLILARDRAGEKPLYFLRMERDRWFPGQTVIFASSAGVLAKLGDAFIGDAGSDLSPAEVQAWTHFGYAGKPPSWDLWTVRPGTVAQEQAWAEGGFQSASYWRPPARSNSATLSPDELEDLLCCAVSSRLEADVPLGCFLSGGVDSSLVAAFAKPAVGRLRTFTVKMPDARYDESVFAERVASHLGTDHLTLPCAARPAEDLVHLIQQLGLPLGDSSLLPTYWLSKAASEHVKVALSGDGGDELFCGYERYGAARWLRDHRALLAAIPLSLLPGGDPKSPASRAARLVRAARGGGYVELLRIFDSFDAHELGCAVHNRQSNAAALTAPADRPLPEADPARYDFETYLPDDLLTKVDTASMAVPLEVRSPFLASEVIERALATPIAVLTPRNQRKGLLRQVARKHLPADIVDRPKMGFAIPLGEWFRTDFGGMKTLLLDHLHAAEPFGSPSLGIDLNRRFIDRMLDEHLAGTRDHAQRLYMLLVLSIWARWMSASERLSK